MIGAKAKVRFDGKKVRSKSKAASITSLGQAGAYIRGIARKSIKVSPTAAQPGKPPHSRKGQLKRAIVFALEQAQSGVVVGPSATAVGRIGHTHEFGGVEPPKKLKTRGIQWRLEVGGYGPVDVRGGKPVFGKLTTSLQVSRAKQIAATLSPALGGPGSKKSRKYPARPFMGPALEISKARLPKFWANSVKGD